MIRTKLEELEMDAIREGWMGRFLIITRFTRGAIAEALQSAHEQRATGRLVIHFSQGTPGDIEFEVGGKWRESDAKIGTSPPAQIVVESPSRG